MITTKYLTQNRTYTSPYKIKPQYIIVHSTAVGYKNGKDQLFNQWNKPSAQLSVHGMTDDKGGYITLPLNYLGWHVGKKGNEKTVGFEICEPGNIAYANANHTKVDTAKYNPKDPAIIADFNKRYDVAVELAAEFCRLTGLDSSKVISHAEGYKLGVASNHGDVGHWFPLFGKSMDGFRADVKKALAKQQPATTTPATTGKLYRVQVGAFSNKANAERLAAELKGKGYSTIIKYD